MPTPIFNILWGARDLLRQPIRSALLLSTVAFGIMGITLFEGFNVGIMNDYRVKTIHGTSGNGKIIRKGYDDQVFEKKQEGWMESTQMLESSLRSLGIVQDTFPRLRFPAFLTNGKVNVVGLGEGVIGIREALFFNALKRSGELLSDQEDGIFLGEGLAQSLNLRVNDPVTVLGSTVDGRLNGMDVRVVGIFRTGMTSIDDVFFRVQLTQAQKLLETNKIESLAVGLKSHEDDPTLWAQVRGLIQERFPDLEAKSFEEMDQVYYGNSIRFLSGQFRLILSIILTIVVLGVLNMISMSVLEREKEIAVLRANGESPNGILFKLMSEGMIIGLLGSLFGVGLALLLNSTLLRHGILMPPAPGFSNSYYAFILLKWKNSFSWIALGVIATLLGTWMGALRTVWRPLGESLRTMEGN